MNRYIHVDVNKLTKLRRLESNALETYLGLRALREEEEARVHASPPAKAVDPWVEKRRLRIMSSADTKTSSAKD